LPELLAMVVNAKDGPRRIRPRKCLPAAVVIPAIRTVLSHLERIDRTSMELHLPESRQHEGGEMRTREFTALGRRVARAPEIVVSSTVWMVDS